MRYRHGIVGLIPHPPFSRFLIHNHNQVDLVMLSRPLPKSQHLGEFICRVDMNQRKWNLSGKSLLRQPNQRVRILAHRPGHSHILKVRECLAKDINALILKVLQIRHK